MPPVQEPDVDDPEIEEPVAPARPGGETPPSTPPPVAAPPTAPRVVFQTPEDLAKKFRSLSPAYEKVPTETLVRGILRNAPMYWSNVNQENFKAQGIYEHGAPGMKLRTVAPTKATILQAVKESLVNTGPGYFLHQYFPNITEKLGIAPTENVLSGPEAEAHRHQLIAPENMLEAMPRHARAEKAGVKESFAHGVLGAAGGMTTAGNLAMLAVPVGGVAGLFGKTGMQVLPRLISAGFTLQMVYSLYKQHQGFKEAMDAGDTNKAAEIAGDMFVTGTMAALTGTHAVKGGGPVETRPFTPEERSKELIGYPELAKPPEIHRSNVSDYRTEQEIQRLREGGKPTTLATGERPPATDEERAQFAAAREQQRAAGQEARGRFDKAEDRTFAGYQLLRASKPGTRLVDPRGNIWRVSDQWLSRVDANGKETGQRQPIASRAASWIAGFLQPETPEAREARRAERGRGRAPAPTVTEPPKPPEGPPGETDFGRAMRQALGSPQQPRGAQAQGPQFEPGVEAVGEQVGRAAEQSGQPTLEGILHGYAEQRMMTPGELREHIEGKHATRRTRDEVAWLENYKRMLGEPMPRKAKAAPPPPPDTEFGAKLRAALQQPKKPAPTPAAEPTAPGVERVAAGVQRAAETSKPPTLEQRVWQMAEARNMDPASLAEDIQGKHASKRTPDEKAWLANYRQWAGSTGLEEPPAPTPAPKAPEPGPKPAPAAEPVAEAKPVEGEGGRAAPEPEAEPPATPAEAPPSEAKQPHEMTRLEYGRAHPDAAIHVPQWVNDVLDATRKGTMTAEEMAGKYSTERLAAIAQLAGVPKGGSKLEIAKRLINAGEMRTILQDETLETLQAKSGGQLKEWTKRVGGYMGGNKRSLAAGLLNWREKSKATARSLLTEANHRRIVERAVKQGLDVPEANLKEYGLKPTTEEPPAAAPAAQLPSDVEIDTARRSGQILGHGGNATVYGINDQFALRIPKSATGKRLGNIVPVEDPFPGRNFGQVVATAGDAQIVRRQAGVPAGVPFGAERSGPNAAKVYAESTQRAAEMPQSAYDDLARDLMFLNENGYQFDPSKANNLLIDTAGKKFNVVDLNPRAGDYRNGAHELAVVLMDNAFANYPAGAEGLPPEMTEWRKQILSKVRKAAEETGLPLNEDDPSFRFSKQLAGERPGPAKIEEPPAPTGEATKPVEVAAPTGPEGDLDKAKEELAKQIRVWQAMRPGSRGQEMAQKRVDAARAAVGKAQAAVDAAPPKPAELGRSRELGSPEKPLYWPEEEQYVYFKDGSWYTQDPETEEWAKAPQDKHNDLIFALKSKALLQVIEPSARDIATAKRYGARPKIEEPPAPTPPTPEPVGRIPNPVAARRQWLRMGEQGTEADELAQRQSMMKPAPRNNTQVAPTQHVMTYLSGFHDNDLLDLAQDRGDIGLMLTPSKMDYLKTAAQYPVIGVDNGAFGGAGFKETRFRDMVKAIAADPDLKKKVRFVVAPDKPFDAAKTLEMFPQWADWIHQQGLPVALAVQNGAENMDIPWDKVDVLFLGGDTDWKIGRKGGDNFYSMLRRAAEEGIPTHMGRVNSAERLEMAGYGLGATTADGTFLKHGPDTNKPRVERWLNAENGRPEPKGPSSAEPTPEPEPPKPTGKAEIEPPPTPEPTGTMTPEGIEALRSQREELYKKKKANTSIRGDANLDRQIEAIDQRIKDHETAVRYSAANEVKPSEPVLKSGDKYKMAGDYYRKALETLKAKWIAQARADNPGEKRSDSELWDTMVSMKIKPGGNLADHPNGQARIEVPDDGKFLVFTSPEIIEAKLRGAGGAFKKPPGLGKGGPSVPKAPAEFNVDAYLAQLDQERKELLAAQSGAEGDQLAHINEELKANEENRRNALAGGEEAPAPKGAKAENVERAERLRPITALKLKRNEAFDVSRGLYHPGGNRQIVSDGHVAVRLDKPTLDSPKANKWKQQFEGYSAGKDTDQSFDFFLDKTKGRKPLNFIGHQLENDRVGDIGYMVDDKNNLYGVNPHKMQMMRDLYGDDIGFEGKTPKEPIVVTKNGEPVGLIMPVDVSKTGIDLPTARRTMAIRGRGPQKDVALGARARRRAKVEEETALEEPPSPTPVRENQPDLFERPPRSPWEEAAVEPYRNMPGRPRQPGAAATPPRGAQRQQAGPAEPPISDEELRAYTGPGAPERGHPLHEKVKEFRQTIGDANKWVRKQIALATLDPDARQMALHERTRLSELATQEAKFHDALSKAGPALNKLGPQGRVAFLIAAEGGKKFENPELQQFADTWKDIQDKLWRKVMKRAGIRKYIENYWAHYWEPRDEAAANQFGQNWIAKRTLEGRKEYLKKRDYPTIEEGIAAGLTLATDDPIEMQMRKIRSMLQFITGDDVVETMKDLGTAKYSFGSAGRAKHIPRDWKELPGPWGKVYGPKSLTIKEAVDANLFKSLNDFARSLGILHMREETMGDGTLGWYDPSTGEVVTKIATPLGTLAHEIGHALDYQYGPTPDQHIWETMQKIGGERGRTIRRELKKLADMRFAGAEDRTSANYKKYVRKGTEKMANMFDAFINMPQLFDINSPDAVAPETGQWLKGYLASNPKLRPLLDIRPSLVRTGLTHELPTGEMEHKGTWYAPASAVDILERSMSAGLSENPLWKTTRFASNSMVAARLSFSGRHMLFTAFEPMASRAARGIKQLTQGRYLEAGKSFGSTPWAIADTLIKGHKAFKEFYGAGVDGIENEQIFKDITSGGGRFQQDPWYITRGMDKLRQSWQEGKPFQGTLLHGFGAAVDAMAYVPMKWWVPRMKLGIFLENAGEEMRNKPFTANDVFRFGSHYFEGLKDENADYAREVVNAIHTGFEPRPPEGMDERTAIKIEDRVKEVYQHARQMKKRETLQNVWDSVDNRLGQIVYDNLFWNRGLKELGQSGVQSLGWNLGFFKEFGGGLIDIGKWAARKKPLSMKAAYTIAYPITLGMMGLMYQYVKTGRKPQNLHDWKTDPFFPHNGDGDERINLPSYINDFYRYGRGFQYGPGEGVRGVKDELLAKTTPIASTLNEMLQNRDFYGTQVYNPEDPLFKKVLDAAKYAGSAYIPYSVANVKKLTESTGKPPGAEAWLESMFGINKAPSSLGETPMEHLLREYAGEFRPSGAMTKEQHQRVTERKQLAERLKLGDPNVNQQIQKDIAGHTLKPKDWEAIHEMSRTPWWANTAKRLSLEQILHAWDEATPQEKRVLVPILRSKGGQLPPDRNNPIWDRWRRALADRSWATAPISTPMTSLQPPPAP